MTLIKLFIAGGLILLLFDAISDPKSAGPILAFVVFIILCVLALLGLAAALGH